MKTYFLVITLIMFRISSFSQSKSGESEVKENSKSRTDSIAKFILINEFSRISSTNTSGGIGSYLGFSTTDNNLTFNYNFKSLNGNVIEFIAKGGVTDGILTAFSQSKLNTGVTLGANYKRLIGVNKIIFNNSDYQTLQYKIDELDFKIKKFQLNISKSIYDFDDKTKKLEDSLDELKKKRDSLNYLNYTLKEKDDKTLKHKLELELIVENLNHDIDVLENDINYQKKLRPNLISKLLNDRDQIENEKSKLLKEKEIFKSDGFSLKWFSIGFSVTNENFNLFDRSLPLESQIYKKNDLVPSINASYTFYSNEKILREKRIRYFSLGGSLKYGNNLQSLNQIEVQTRDTIDFNRVIFKSQKTYQGLYKDNVATANLFCDYYLFFNNTNNIGSHFRLTVDLGPFAPVTSCRIGLLLSALNESKSNAISNIEVFFGLNDIFKSQGEQSLFNRNVLGIQTSFPFK